MAEQIKLITVQDCLELQKKFIKYTETAEQHEFPKLYLIDVLLHKTIDNIQAAGKVKNQKDIRAMFRVVLKAIGENVEKTVCELFTGGHCPVCDDEYEDMGISYKEAQKINKECCKNSRVPDDDELRGDHET